MVRYHGTPEGNVQFTEAEELARDAEEAEWASGENDRLAVDARKNRNDLLAETDWTASSDVTMSDAMKAYRQALRDVPAQEGFPTDINWPELGE